MTSSKHSTSATPISPDEPASRLGIAIGEDHWLIDLAEAGEILPMPETVTPVPGTRKWFHGLTNLRGSLFGVTDLAAFLGRSLPVYGKEARLLAFSEKLHVNAAILVSRMMGLQNMATMKHDAATPDQGWMGRTFIDASGVRWRELHLSRLCRDREFLAIAR